MMGIERRPWVGLVLACLTVLGAAACDSDDDRTAEVMSSAGVQGTHTEADDTRSGWQAFKLNAVRDLEAIAQDFEEVGKGLVGLEREAVDKWKGRLEHVRAEMAKEVEEAPEARKHRREELKREVEEIKDEARTLLAKLGVGKAGATGSKPSE